MKFRAVQSLLVGVLLGQWALRCALSPSFHWHATGLWMILLAAASSEIGYRAGLAQRSRVNR